MATAVQPHPASDSGRRHGHGYLISPAVDLPLLILSPLLALGVAALVAGGSVGRVEVTVLGLTQPVKEFLIGSLIAGHLAVSFVRSHGNAAVFDRHPYRFTVVPLAVLALIAGSGWFRALAGVVAVLWDVHHSGMQTFGLARLYESRNGNDPRVGRRLDLWLNQLLYAGPILAGAGFLLHYRALGPDLARVGDGFFTPLLALASGPPRWLSLAIVGLGLPSLAGYAIASIRLRRRRGHRSVGPKFLLLVATGFCSVVSWGFNSFGEALFTMKLFHVVQYFTLIAWRERRTVAEGLGVEASRFSLGRAAAVLVVSASVFGLWAELQQARAAPSDLALSLILTVNLMHFWYDGFMWSVRKGEI